MSASVREEIKRAQTLPIRFALVREDPVVDLAVVDRVASGRPIDVLLVGSGGCTAALLEAKSAAKSLTLVDPNRSQLSLARLKLDLLRREPPRRRGEILGHRPFDNRERELTNQLDGLGLDPDALGPLPLVSALGPDDAGRYERLFAALRTRIDELGVPLEPLWNAPSIEAQREAVGPDRPIGESLDIAFRDVFSLDHLVDLFGESATQNPRIPFHEHFTHVLRIELERRLARDNAFVVSLLWGPTSAREASPAWLELPPTRALDTTFVPSNMQSYLDAADERYDVIHLSNVTDWIDATAARQLLESARARLRPGGAVILRQLNSTLDLDATLEGFEVWPGENERLAADRSFFYRRVVVGTPR